jgi:hypothetical protein
MKMLPAIDFGGSKSMLPGIIRSFLTKDPGVDLDALGDIHMQGPKTGADIDEDGKNIIGVTYCIAIIRLTYMSLTGQSILIVTIMSLIRLNQIIEGGKNDTTLWKR